MEKGAKQSVIDDYVCHVLLCVLLCVFLCVLLCVVLDARSRLN
jgi:hypothetical protein